MNVRTQRPANPVLFCGRTQGLYIQVLGEASLFGDCKMDIILILLLGGSCQI